MHHVWYLLFALENIHGLRNDLQVVPEVGGLQNYLSFPQSGAFGRGWFYHLMTLRLRPLGLV